jgi:hypothetical protein
MGHTAEESEETSFRTLFINYWMVSVAGNRPDSLTYALVLCESTRVCPEFESDCSVIGPTPRTNNDASNNKAKDC